MRSRRLDSRDIVLLATALATVAVLGLVGLAYDDLPNPVAVHWDERGIADQSAGREAVVIAPIVCLSVAWLCLLLLRPTSHSVTTGLCLAISLIFFLQVVLVQSNVNQNDWREARLSTSAVAVATTGFLATVLCLTLVVRNGRVMTAKRHSAANVEILVEPDTVTVRPRRWDVLLTLSMGFTLPRRSITSVTIVQEDNLRGGLRLKGTSVPGKIKAGTFRHGGALEFWDVRRGDFLELMADEGSRYRRICVQPNNLAAVLGTLTDGS